MSWHHDDDGSLVIRGRLGPEEGAVVIKALEAAARPEDAPAGSSRTESPPRPPRRLGCDASVLAMVEADGEP